MNKQKSRNDAFWAIATQWLLIITLSLLIWMMGSLQTAASFVLGGMICVLANTYYYWRVFSHFGARAAKQILKAFYWGQCLKILLTAGGFVCALLIPRVAPLWLFAGYITAQGGFWLAPLVLGIIRMKNRSSISKTWES